MVGWINDQSHVGILVYCWPLLVFLRCLGYSRGRGAHPVKVMRYLILNISNLYSIE